MLAVYTLNLTHRFGANLVLRGVDLAVPKGAIYGFLGPNGAGKTTTLRLILGLLRRQLGRIEVFGRTLESDRLGILRSVGSSIESPSVYGHLTAAENLEVWRRVFGCDRHRVPDVLALVGLAGTGAKRADQFSLGMKQRLAIAVALLHEPSLLILDEPTNGLDPQGILEMRRLLGRLSRDRGVTILVSSHILSEVERVVTHIGIIHLGSMRFQGTLDALRARTASSSATTVDTSDNRRAVDILARADIPGRVVRDRAVFCALSRDDAGRLTTVLAANGIVVYEITTAGNDLEQIFLDMVGGAE